MTKQDRWKVGELELTSRVLMGTARFASQALMLESLAASETELVTMALRRVKPTGEGGNLYAALREGGYRLLPNTAGCFTAHEAVLTAKLAREALGTSLLKLEVVADDTSLLPDPVELLSAAETLVRDGFTVLPYTNDDPILARRLEDLGCAAVMPLAAPIGSGLGIRNPHNLALIRSYARVPVIVDAGLGTASDVALAFELGMDAVLVNSMVSRAEDPVSMAHAVRHAALGGRMAFTAGRMPKRDFAEASSSLEGRAFRS